MHVDYLLKMAMDWLDSSGSRAMVDQIKRKIKDIELRIPKAKDESARAILEAALAQEQAALAKLTSQSPRNPGDYIFMGQGEIPVYKGLAQQIADLGGYGFDISTYDKAREVASLLYHAGPARSLRDLIFRSTPEEWEQIYSGQAKKTPEGPLVDPEPEPEITPEMVEGEPEVYSMDTIKKLLEGPPKEESESEVEKAGSFLFVAAEPDDELDELDDLDRAELDDQEEPDFDDIDPAEAQGLDMSEHIDELDATPPAEEAPEAAPLPDPLELEMSDIPEPAPAAPQQLSEPKLEAPAKPPKPVVPLSPQRQESLNEIDRFRETIRDLRDLGFNVSSKDKVMAALNLLGGGLQSAAGGTKNVPKAELDGKINDLKALASFIGHLYEPPPNDPDATPPPGAYGFGTFMHSIAPKEREFTAPQPQPKTIYDEEDKKPSKKKKVVPPGPGSQSLLKEYEEGQIPEIAKLNSGGARGKAKGMQDLVNNYWQFENGFKYLPAKKPGDMPRLPENSMWSPVTKTEWHGLRFGEGSNIRTYDQTGTNRNALVLGGTILHNKGNGQTGMVIGYVPGSTHVNAHVVGVMGSNGKFQNWDTNSKDVMLSAQQYKPQDD